MLANGWWRGIKGEEEGFFPGSYVRVKGEEKKEPEKHDGEIIFMVLVFTFINKNFYLNIKIQNKSKLKLFCYMQILYICTNLHSQI